MISKKMANGLVGINNWFFSVSMPKYSNVEGEILPDSPDTTTETTTQNPNLDLEQELLSYPCPNVTPHQQSGVNTYPNCCILLGRDTGSWGYRISTGYGVKSRNGYKFTKLSNGCWITKYRDGVSNVVNPERDTEWIPRGSFCMSDVGCSPSINGRWATYDEAMEIQNYGGYQF